MLFISVIGSTTTNTKVGVHGEEEGQYSVVPEPFPSTGELPEEYVMLST
jgi:hypothetical protein